MKNFKSAFTMVELVFVIVVVGILAGVAIPKLAATRDDAYISKAKTQVASVRNALSMERQKRILRGDFEMFYQIVGNNGQLFNATDVIDTYVFRSLLQNADIGMTAAATFYQSVLCFIIIMVVNAIVKHINADYALF